MGCDWGEGYLFARPVVADQITQMLAAVADDELHAA